MSSRDNTTLRSAPKHFGDGLRGADERLDGIFRWGWWRGSKFLWWPTHTHAALALGLGTLWFGRLGGGWLAGGGFGAAKALARHAHHTHRLATVHHRAQRVCSAGQGRRACNRCRARTVCASCLVLPRTTRTQWACNLLVVYKIGQKLVSINIRHATPRGARSPAASTPLQHARLCRCSGTVTPQCTPLHRSPTMWIGNAIWVHALTVVGLDHAVDGTEWHRLCVTAVIMHEPHAWGLFIEPGHLQHCVGCLLYNAKGQGGVVKAVLHNVPQLWGCCRGAFCCCAWCAVCCC